MIPDTELLHRFEKGLNPQELKAAAIPASIVGYGEISVILEIANMPGIVFKRLPIFPSRPRAEKYAEMYRDYCRYLCKAGLSLPESDTWVVEAADRPTVLYIAQEKLPPDRFAHTLIQHRDKTDCRKIFTKTVFELDKVWQFNQRRRPGLELAIDGQLSNWVIPDSNERAPIFYIDTSTPLFRVDGAEQQDPEPLLSSTPFFLRWMIRLLFLDEVMSRYYVPRLVYTDLAANLHKEQRPDLVPDAVAVINQALPESENRLTVSEVGKYYKGDKRIWRVFLMFRKIDRWLQRNILRKRYEFILPGKINR
jgi:hypothetical protein